MRSDSCLAKANHTGVLLLHGFTGSLASVRPWAPFLAEAGYSISVPRLPGHGTEWREMNQPTQLFIARFSMGGALGGRLSKRHPERVTGLIVLNPALLDPHGFMRRVSALRFFKAMLRPTASDIAKPNPPIHGYRETPLTALHSLSQLIRDIRSRVSHIDQPILLFRSIQDHVGSAACSEFILHE
jgi:carboxylesterase